MQKIKDFLGKVKDWSIVILYYISLISMCIKWCLITSFDILKYGYKLSKDETIDGETYETMINVYMDCKEVEFNQKVDNFINCFEERFSE